MDDDIEDLTIPFINIKSIVEEREIYHEEELQKVVLELVEAMCFQSNIEQALDKGEEEVIIDFPEYFQQPLSEIFVGKIRFRDVFRNFSGLMAKEAYPIEFEWSFDGGCCLQPEAAWNEEEPPWRKGESEGDLACCYHCDKTVHYWLGQGAWGEWKLVWKKNSEEKEYVFSKVDCCKKMKELNEDSRQDLRADPPCLNCLGPYYAISESWKKPEHMVPTKLKIKLR